MHSHSSRGWWFELCAHFGSYCSLLPQWDLKKMLVFRGWVRILSEFWENFFSYSARMYVHRQMLSRLQPDTNFFSGPTTPRKVVASIHMTEFQCGGWSFPAQIISFHKVLVRWAVFMLLFCWCWNIHRRWSCLSIPAGPLPPPSIV